MTRSALRPIRTRRLTRDGKSHVSEPTGQTARLTPATRKTLAAVGALWVSFAVNTSATPDAPAEPEANAKTAGTGAAPDSSPVFMSPLIDCTESDDPDHRSSQIAGGKSPTFGILESTPLRKTVVPPPASAGTTSGTTLPASESRDVVFLTTGPDADESLPRAPEPKGPSKETDLSAALDYLRSISK